MALRAAVPVLALGASALTIPEDSLQQLLGGREEEQSLVPSILIRYHGPLDDGPLVNPKPADMAGWLEGPKVVATSDLHHAEVPSIANPDRPNLSIQAFDPWIDQQVSGHLIAGEGWETMHIKKLCEYYYNKGAVGNFLDVGANIGTFTIPMADCLAGKGRVLAVEGMPPIVDHLVIGILGDNISNVDVFNYAVGAPDDPGEVTMSLNPVNKGGSTVKGNKPFTEMNDQQLQDLFHPNKKAQKYAQKMEVKEFAVPLTTGDAMLTQSPGMKTIMVAKIDIEGHEGHFLKGSQLLFSRYPPCVVTIELIPDWLERAGTPVEEILDQLSRWGYVGPTGKVTTAQELKKAKSEAARTRMMFQKDMAKCIERVSAIEGDRREAQERDQMLEASRK